MVETRFRQLAERVPRQLADRALDVLVGADQNLLLESELRDQERERLREAGARAAAGCAAGMAAEPWWCAAASKRVPSAST